MALLSFRGISTPSLPAQGEQRRSSYFNIPRGNSFVDAGGLMAYSFDLAELFERAADDIHAILDGADPGDIPFYQASKFELSLNLKTAKALSLSVPPTLLAAADKVVE
jgi:ABC-type uncharacterized transport system substrate-binding protein